MRFTHNYWNCDVNCVTSAFIGFCLHFYHSLHLSTTAWNLSHKITIKRSNIKYNQIIVELIPRLENCRSSFIATNHRTTTPNADYEESSHDRFDGVFSPDAEVLPRRNILQPRGIPGAGNRTRRLVERSQRDSNWSVTGIRKQYGGDFVQRVVFLHSEGIMKYIVNRALLLYLQNSMLYCFFKTDDENCEIIIVLISDDVWFLFQIVINAFSLQL